MDCSNKCWARRLAMFALILIAAARISSAQTLTTGTLSGVAVDQQGAALPGASVAATHVDTGTKYDAVTQADGRFEIPNVRVGTYTVAVSLSGFKTQTQNNIVVRLGDDQPINFKLPLETITETVTVVGQAVFSSTRAGTAENISADAVQTLPTIQRSLFDFARTSPYFNLSPDSAGGDGFISVAGRNNRYNNIQIDGSVNNDVFGLAASGTPAGQTSSQPISLDAIQEIQLVVAPYDVRQGGFSGGGINAVTKSGSNSLTGTGYFFARNQGLIGQIPGVVTPANPSPADTSVGTFSDRQGGLSAGGPIMLNKAFFFANVDWARKNTPAGFSADGSSGQSWGHQSEVQQILNIAQNQYGYVPGGLGQFSRPTNSNKVFVRADFNVSPRNQLTVRTNYVSSLNDAVPSAGPTNTTYVFPDGFPQFSEKVSSTVAQFNTTSTHAFNEFRVTYQKDDFTRGPQPDFAPFPYIRVDLADNTNVRFGTELSSQANQLNQDIVEVTDDFTWLKGKHTFTVGTHNEFFHFYDVFVQNIYGNYEFSSIANFQAGIAQSYSHNFSNTANPLQPIEFSVHQFGVYAGDQWRAAPNLTVTYGVRLDIPQFPDTPRSNPLTIADFNRGTDVVPAPKMWSPRIGFNWDLSNGSQNRSQVRGGIGIFTGRTPYVWLSNQYGNTGLDFTNLSVSFNTSVRIPFVSNPNGQPSTVTGGATGRQSVNLIDPDYKFPEVVRGNIAYDRALGFWGLVGTAEYLFNKNMKEIAYSNINYIPTGTLPDGRITYSKLDGSINDALLLSNTSLGSQNTLSFKIEKPFKHGFYASGSYSYNHSTSINDGTASTAGSNWANNPVQFDTNNAPLTRSNFDAGSRVNLTASIPIPLGTRYLSSMASFFYNGEQGRPYVILFTGDANGDARSNNDIAYIPATPDQVVLTNGTWQQLDAFLSSDPASKDNRGTIPARNSGRAPWHNDLDFRYAVNVATRSRVKIEATMDVFNLLNLLNKDWGWVYFPLFPASGGGLIGYGGIDKATGKEILNLSTITSQSFQGTFTRDDLRSRWQAQWGLRIRF